jgi:hypothetical protein
MKNIGEQLVDNISESDASKKIPLPAPIDKYVKNHFHAISNHTF